MCGLAGVLRIHPAGQTPPPPLEAIPEAWLDVLDEGIKHRGPDGQGRFRDRAMRPDGAVVDVAFVHRRLSILDHEGGHQPMVHDGERLRPDLTYQPGEEPKLAHELCPARPLVAVVFNGCIYNQHELRMELGALGYRLETDHSDTEVLVHGWRAWGPSYSMSQPLAAKLEGMFSLGTWCRERCEVYLARDLSGEKPLYFASKYPIKHYHDNDQRSGYDLCFSSTLPSVDIVARSLRPMGRFVDRQPQARSWIRFGASSSTLSNHVHTFPASSNECNPRTEVGRFSPGAMSSEEVQAAKPVRGVGCMSAGLLQDFLTKSICERLEADVPLGVFLSGGVDSGLIAAIAKRELPELKTFTVRMPDARFDESEAAADTARALGTDHATLECQPDPAGDMVHLIQQLGLPFGDSSLLPTFWLCKAAREHIKVALSGDGGDELFGGYRRHAITPTLNRWHRLLRLVPDRLLDRRTPGSRSDYLARLAVAARHGGYEELLAIFQTPDLRRLVPSADGERLGSDEFARVNDPLTHDFTHYLPDDLLRKTDTASMAVALEVRAPFLARGLVEAALRTPLDVLMPGGERKGLLKRVAREYLPAHVVDRRKQGFAIPIGRWFREDYGGMRQLLYDHLQSADPFPGLGGAGVEIDLGFVERMLREHDAAGERSLNPWKGRDHSQRLYMLLVLSIWAKWLAGLRGNQSKNPSHARGAR
ncbi:MAG: asparagine synthase (glutamine-hydrolyzing) [Planctomycetota bacterium]